MRMLLQSLWSIWTTCSDDRVSLAFKCSQGLRQMITSHIHEISTNNRRCITVLKLLLNMFSYGGNLTAFKTYTLSQFDFVWLFGTSIVLHLFTKGPMSLTSSRGRPASALNFLRDETKIHSFLANGKQMQLRWLILKVPYIYFLIWQIAKTKTNSMYMYSVLVTTYGR